MKIYCYYNTLTMFLLSSRVFNFSSLEKLPVSLISITTILFLKFMLQYSNSMMAILSFESHMKPLGKARSIDVHIKQVLIK